MLSRRVMFFNSPYGNRDTRIAHRTAKKKNQEQRARNQDIRQWTKG